MGLSNSKKKDKITKKYIYEKIPLCNEHNMKTFFNSIKQQRTEINDNDNTHAQKESSCYNKPNYNIPPLKEVVQLQQTYMLNYNSFSYLIPHLTLTNCGKVRHTNPCLHYKTVNALQNSSKLTLIKPLTSSIFLIMKQFISESTELSFQHTIPFELDHFVLPKQYSLYHVDNNIYSIIPFAKYSSLLSKVNKQFSPNQVKFILFQLLSACYYLHEIKHIAHLGITLDNILLYEIEPSEKGGKEFYYWIYLTNYSKATLIENIDDNNISKDIYDIGVVAYCLLTKQSVYDNYDERLLMHSCMSDIDLVNLIERMLMINCNENISAKNALQQHNVFNKNDVLSIKCSSVLNDTSFMGKVKYNYNYFQLKMNNVLKLFMFYCIKNYMYLINNDELRKINLLYIALHKEECGNGIEIEEIKKLMYSEFLAKIVNPVIFINNEECIEHSFEDMKDIINCDFGVYKTMLVIV